VKNKENEKAKVKPAAIEESKVAKVKITGTTTTKSKFQLYFKLICYYFSESVQAPPKDLGPEPKSALSAFNLFTSDKQKELKASNPDLA